MSTAQRKTTVEPLVRKAIVAVVRLYEHGCQVGDVAEVLEALLLVSNGAGSRAQDLQSEMLSSHPGGDGAAGHRLLEATLTAIERIAQPPIHKACDIGNTRARKLPMRQEMNNGSGSP